MILQVITKCNAPGQLALAYDDGPYQYTQKLVDTLTAGGAKGTFFVTGQITHDFPHSTCTANVVNALTRHPIW
jgi:peptidoglycan/xylan/chitin deacetylase (PgdA/CDA1 family)